MWIIGGFVAVVIIAFVFTAWYCKGEKPKQDATIEVAELAEEVVEEPVAKVAPVPLQADPRRRLPRTSSKKPLRRARKYCRQLVAVNRRHQGRKFVAA